MKDKIQQMFLMKRGMPEICDVIAKHLMSKYYFKTVSGEKMNECYVYIDGIFQKKGKNIIEQEAEEILEEASKTYLINEIRNKIERLTKIERSDLGCRNKNLICVRNGVLNLVTKNYQSTHTNIILLVRFRLIMTLQQRAILFLIF